MKNLRAWDWKWLFLGVPRKMAMIFREETEDFERNGDFRMKEYKKKVVL